MVQEDQALARALILVRALTRCRHSLTATCRWCNSSTDVYPGPNDHKNCTSHASEFIKISSDKLTYQYERVGVVGAKMSDDETEQKQNEKGEWVLEAVFSMFAIFMVPRGLQCFQARDLGVCSHFCLFYPRKGCTKVRVTPTPNLYYGVYFNKINPIVQIGGHTNILDTI